MRKKKTDCKLSEVKKYWAETSYGPVNWSQRSSTYTPSQSRNVRPQARCQEKNTQKITFKF